MHMCNYPFQGYYYPQSQQLPGTLLKVNIPPGAVINLLNLFEISSPEGINLVVRSPLLGGGMGLGGLANLFGGAGGPVQQMAGRDFRSGNPSYSYYY
jgi:hypothetical protein